MLQRLKQSIRGQSNLLALLQKSDSESLHQEGFLLKGGELPKLVDDWIPETLSWDLDNERDEQRAGRRDEKRDEKRVEKMDEQKAELKENLMEQKKDEESASQSGSYSEQGEYLVHKSYSKQPLVEEWDLNLQVHLSEIRKLELKVTELAESWARLSQELHPLQSGKGSLLLGFLSGFSLGVLFAALVVGSQGLKLGRGSRYTT